MNKLIIAIIVLLATLVAGCKKDTFDYQLYQPKLEEIDSVYFSAGDLSLIADGQASLKFIVETYRKIKGASGADSMAFVDYRLLPEGSLKVYETVSGKEVGMTYATTSTAINPLKFYAQVGNIKSSVKSVTIRPNPTLPPKVYVDVIFHVFELSPAHPTYDLSSYIETSYDSIVKAVAIMNQVVNNQIGSDPNGASANVEFRLATKDANGVTLAQPGYDKYVYGDEVKANPLATTFVGADFKNFVNNNVARFIWNPDAYLNVEVLPYGSGTSFGNLVPPVKQLAPGAGETPILGISTVYATSKNDYIKDFVNATAFVPYTLFVPGPERTISIFSFIGSFYGLNGTSTYSTARLHSDYCLDTQEFDNNDKRNNFLSAIKVGINGEKFISDYAMDDTRYPSSRTSITLDQVKRMRAVMARCPGRMNSHP